jgi:dolichol-phosphate mannosyltransferase
MNEGYYPLPGVPPQLRPARAQTMPEPLIESADHEQTIISHTAPHGASAATPAATPPALMEMAVVVPTLNERENIQPLVQGILASDPRLHVIIVDDGSADGTAQWVRDFAASDTPDAARAHLIDRGRKLGYASAVQDGMRLALKNGARWILQMDADFSHDPKYLPAILKKMASDEFDLVIGSRYVPGGGTRNWGINRKIISGGANALARALLELPAHDCTAGFRCWKRELIEKSGVLDVKVQGYAFLFMTLHRCARLGAKVGEVPIIFVDRQYGKSKMSRRIVVEAVRVLWRLWWQHVRRKDV